MANYGNIKVYIVFKGSFYGLQYCLHVRNVVYPTISGKRKLELEYMSYNFVQKLINLETLKVVDPHSK